MCSLQRGDHDEKNIFVHEHIGNERCSGGWLSEGRYGRDHGNCGNNSRTEYGTESTFPAESETSDDAEILKNYHLLQGVIVKTDSEKGTFTVKTDDGAEYTLATENIHDVETEIADDSVVAIGYIGEELHDSDQLKDVELVIAAPGDDDWTIAYAEGTTTANAMSTFTMVTADGTEMGFMKDGCPMDEDALGGDSGAKVGVVYMDSEDVSFPLEIKKLEE